MKRVLLVASLVVPVAACASARAKVPVESVTLEVPPVPPRSIEAPVTVVPPDIEPVQPLPQPETPPPSRPRQQPRPAAPQPPAPEAKPEPAPEIPQAPATAAVPPLRTPAAGDGADAQRQVTDIVASAKRLLSTIDRGGLSDERKVNYDSASNFVKQAEEALKASNLVLARSLAERAENYAKLLGGR